MIDALNKTNAKVWVQRLLPLLIFLPPLLVLFDSTWDFFAVAFGRMFYPFEVEWLEGELAIYSVRFLENASLAHLYPAYEQGDYVPHLYPPFYQIVSAWIYQLFQVVFYDAAKPALFNLLPAGRFLSVLATIGIMSAVVVIVREATRSWYAGVIGALSYLMYFKAAGFWYDVFKVDSLAYAMALWAAFFFTRRRGGYFSIIIATVLSFLCFATKQTSVYLPILAFLVRLTLSSIQVLTTIKPVKGLSLGPNGTGIYKCPQAVLVGLLPALMILVNFIYFTNMGQENHLAFYLLEVPKSHHIFYDKIESRGYQELWQYMLFLPLLMPLGLFAMGFGRNWKTPTLCGAMVAVLLVVYTSARVLAGWADFPVPMPKESPSFGALIYTISTWPKPIEIAAIMTAAAMGFWGVRWLFYRTQLPGLWWFGAFLGSHAVAAVTWVKIGGYTNNFIPLFAVQSVAYGLAIAWLFQGMRRVAGLPGVAIASLLTAVALYFTWYGTRDMMVLRMAGSEEALPKYAAMDVYHLNLSDEEREGRPRPAITHDLPMWLSDGLRYDRPAFVVATEEPATREDGVVATYSALREDGLSRWDSIVYTVSGKNYRKLRDRNSLGGQLPDPRWEEWYPRLFARLTALQEDGGVYLPHHNYLGYMAGVPIQPSIDSIRDVDYMVGKTPAPLILRLSDKDPRHLILSMDLRYEWFTGDFKRAVQRNYREKGALLPGLPPSVFAPTTGAMVKPSIVYTAR